MLFLGIGLHIPYMPEYKSHPSISHTLYSSEEKLDLKI